MNFPPVLRHPCVACRRWYEIQPLTWVSPATAVCAKPSMCGKLEERRRWLPAVRSNQKGHTQEPGT